MKKVLIIQNCTLDGEGLLKEVLTTHNISYDIIHFDKKHEFPLLQKYSAIFSFGGPDSANDQTSKMLLEIAYVKEALKRNIPFLGICLGLQVLVKAAGGKVVKNPIKELGFKDEMGKPYEVVLTEQGLQDPLCQGLPPFFRTLELHGETVELTDAMTLLASGSHCINQIVKVAPKVYGTQFHSELTPEMMKAWISKDSDLQSSNAQAMLHEF